MGEVPHLLSGEGVLLNILCEGLPDVVEFRGPFTPVHFFTPAFTNKESK